MKNTLVLDFGRAVRGDVPRGWVQYNEGWAVEEKCVVVRGQPFAARTGKLRHSSGVSHIFRREVRLHLRDNSDGWAKSRGYTLWHGR